WDQRLDKAGPAETFLHRLDVSTPGVKVTDHVAHVILGRRDVYREHRLQQHRLDLPRRLLECHRPGNLECELGGVDVVVLPVHQGDPDVHHRIAGKDPELHRLLGAFVHGGDVLPRNPATGDLVHEL